MTILFEGKVVRNTTTIDTELGTLRLIPHPKNPAEDVVGLDYKNREAGLAVRLETIACREAAGERTIVTPLLEKYGVSWFPQLPSKER